MSWSIKSIRTQIQLRSGSFKGGGNSRTVEGLATDAVIEKIGLPDMNKARVKIYGMCLDDMEQLTFLAFKPLQSARNILRVWAGEEGGNMSLVFQGEIITATADFNTAPDVSFNIEAMTGAYPIQIAQAPVSVKGSAPASTLINQFANDMGYKFQNEGVTASVQNSVYNGSPLEKAKAVAAQVGAEMIVEDDTITLLKSGNVRKGGTVSVLSAQSGLIGYPRLTAQGISCRCMFNPTLRMLSQIKIESIVPRASGIWRIYKLVHNLSAYKPGGGPWESQIEASWLNL